MSAPLNPEKRSGMAGQPSGLGGADALCLYALSNRKKKPPKSPPRSAKETPSQYELTVPSFQSGKTFSYAVQLPPEYDPNRKYPTVVSLGAERSNPLQQLNWWSGPWTEKTNAQGKKVYERYGQASRYGYIVVAPKWNEGVQNPDLSALLVL